MARRVLDYLFFVYFLTHIPIALLVDFQAVVPARFYPQALVDLKTWYCQEFRDPMMVDPPPWFLSFCVCEMLVQFPFFFVATYAFFKGAAQARWIRIPLIVYSSHVVTTLIAIYFHNILYDFSQTSHPGPRTLRERLTLCSIYSPYLLCPLLSLLDASFSSVYREEPAAIVKQKRG